MYVCLYFNYYNLSLTLFRFYCISPTYIIQGKLMGICFHKLGALRKGLFFIMVTMLMGSDFIQINVMKVKEHKIMELW